FDMNPARRLGEAEQAEVAEVRLFRGAVFHRDLSVERLAQAEDHGSFELRTRALHVHDDSRVGDDPSLVDPDLAARVLHDGDDDGDVREDAPVHREAERALRLRAVLPAGELRDALDDPTMTGGVDGVVVERLAVVRQLGDAEVTRLPRARRPDDLEK